MIPGSNEQQLEYTLLKPDCHSWWISKMQSGREDTLEEQYAITVLKLEKMPQKRMECFTLLLEHFAWIEHRFLSGIRDSKAESLCGMMKGRIKEVNTSELIGQSVRVRIRVSYVEVLREFRKRYCRKKPALFKSGQWHFYNAQCTSPQLHPCHRLFDQDRHQDSSLPSLQSRPCSLWHLIIP